MTKYYVADFETNNHIEDCHVWCWCIHEIGQPDNTAKVGTSLETFMELIFSLKNPVIYFHNLKFDIQFIIPWLFTNGYTHVKGKPKKNEFGTLITDMNVYYATNVCTVLKGKTNTIKFLDSYKKLPFKVSVLAKSYGLEITKGEIDYNLFRPVGYVPTAEEIDYVIRDVLIVSKVLKIYIDKGYTKMTIASDCMEDFKKSVTPKMFDILFHPLPLDEDGFIREAYKGGWVYCNPEIAGKDIHGGMVLDVNSLYPWAMRDNDNALPCGEPLFFTGRYEGNEICGYPLYVQRMRVSFKLKEGKLPTIQLRKSFGYNATHYLTETNNGEEVEITLTSVDLELFKEQYDIIKVKYLDGYCFRMMRGIFDKYIDKWYKIKSESELAEKAIAKLFLNSLYGKFAMAKLTKSREPEMVDEVVKYKMQKYQDEFGNEVDYEISKGVYVPMACFITAYARRKTITTAQKLHDQGRFLYSDTDSVHISGTEDPVYIEISPDILGAWKKESVFEKAKFLRAKTYIEVIDGEKDIKCAGMPQPVKDTITYEDFKYGFTTADSKYIQENGIVGKLVPKIVKNGVVLITRDFSLKKEKVA